MNLKVEDLEREVLNRTKRDAHNEERSIDGGADSLSSTSSLISNPNP